MIQWLLPATLASGRWRTSDRMPQDAGRPRPRRWPRHRAGMLNARERGTSPKRPRPDLSYQQDRGLPQRFLGWYPVSALRHRWSACRANQAQNGHDDRVVGGSSGRLHDLW